MQIRPLSARSVVLSLLLGAHPPELPARDLVAVAEHFGIAEATLRVALTRMVAAGDLHRADGTYRLSTSMLKRQERQDAALAPPRTSWDGDWEQVVITSIGRSAAERADLRSTLTELKLAELREGVWLRPANLQRELPPWPADLIRTFRVAAPTNAIDLARNLWVLDSWSLRGHELLATVAMTTSGADRLAVAAALVRHLRTDPALPADLLPDDWPAERLRTTYAEYQAELVASGMQLVVTSPE